MDNRQSALPIDPEPEATEWPVPSPSPSPAPKPAPQPIALADAVAVVASPAMDAFIARRLEQLAKGGHTPAKDAEQPPFRLPKKAQEYLIDALDYIGHGDGAFLDPERRATALRKLEIAGALLLAAHDRVSAIPTTQGPQDIAQPNPESSS